MYNACGGSHPLRNRGTEGGSALDILCNLINPVGTLLHIPTPILPLSLLKMFSASGANGLLWKELKEQALEGLLFMSIPDHVRYYMEQGIDKKEAMKKAAKDRGIGKRDVYQALLDAEIRNECADEQGEQSYT